eukprot:TRINITY_DN87283_c0_g1_i1.p1 TRINITY_DN87283_c0_g1~~TRINITY_DN87283_c0_g1_i1.p1  ORF type:complete len:147 (-),score=43.47 TRINITY_DN87283_c0_g1_i1:45-485(-)
MATAIRYLSCSQLVEEYCENPSGLQVIDCRDDDYAGGHIDGARNIPAYKFGSVVSDLVAELKDKDVKVVFHCMQSQIRGPQCAQVFLSELGKQSGGKAKCSVYILSGGFRRFVTHWQKMKSSKSTPKKAIEIMRDYDADSWEFSWS